jgi:hypothetical protein
MSATGGYARGCETPDGACQSDGSSTHGVTAINAETAEPAESEPDEPKAAKAAKRLSSRMKETYA